jgi:hypothetical protein
VERSAHRLLASAELDVVTTAGLEAMVRRRRRRRAEAGAEGGEEGGLGHGGSGEGMGGQRRRGRWAVRCEPLRLASVEGVVWIRVSKSWFGTTPAGSGFCNAEGAGVATICSFIRFYSLRSKSAPALSGLQP